MMGIFDSTIFIVQFFLKRVEKKVQVSFLILHEFSYLLSFTPNYINSKLPSVSSKLIFGPELEISAFAVNLALLIE